LVEDYRSVTQCSVGSGTSVLFWKDFWREGELLCDKFHRLFSYVLNEDMSVAKISMIQNLISCFVLPLSVEAYDKFQQVSQLIADHLTDSSAQDQRVFVWGSSKYAASKFYNLMFAQLPKDPALNAIWKSRSMPKLKVFAWLLMLDHLNTRELMIRKNWHLDSGPECVLRDEILIESRDHLYFDCSLAQQCWEDIGIQWDTSLQFTDRFIQSRRNYVGPCFLEVMVCVAWNIWEERNDYIFQGEQPSIGRWRVRFQNDLRIFPFLDIKF
jgi:hypothetical protein